MHTKPLTKIQRDWLDHVKQATKQKKLALKAFYNARSSLMQKGILPSISSHHLVLLTQTLANNPTVSTSCRITLCNGIIIELADVGISDLLNSANRL